MAISFSRKEVPGEEDLALFVDPDECSFAVLPVALVPPGQSVLTAEQLWALSGPVALGFVDPSVFNEEGGELPAFLLLIKETWVPSEADRTLLWYGFGEEGLRQVGYVQLDLVPDGPAPLKLLRGALRIADFELGLLSDGAAPMTGAFTSLDSGPGEVVLLSGVDLVARLAQSTSGQEDVRLPLAQVPDTPQGTKLLISLTLPGEWRFRGLRWPAADLFRLFQPEAARSGPVPTLDCRFYYPDGEGTAMLRYPVGLPASSDAAFDVSRGSITPHQPFDAESTRLSFDVATLPKGDGPTPGPCLLGPDGKLLPVEPGGDFGINFMPTPEPPGCYPGPGGSLKIQPPPSDAVAHGLWAVGLTATEFIDVRAEAPQIVFWPGPAWAAGFRAQPGGGEAAPDGPVGPALTEEAQASWVSYWDAESSDKGQYFGQAGHAPFFSPEAFPEVESIDPRPVAGALSLANGSFPVGFYGGLAPRSREELEVYERFERSVLSRARRASIMRTQTVEPLKWNGTPEPFPKFKQWGKLDPLVGQAVSPQGFLVQLTGGDWRQVVLATMQVPGQDVQQLALPSLKAEGVTCVWPALVQGLLHEHVFLVADRWNYVAPLVTPASPDELPARTGHPILVLKYQRGHTLAELMSSEDHWLDPDNFIEPDDRKDAGDGKTRFQEIWEEWLVPVGAEDDEPTEEFAHIHELVYDPDWQGILILNAPIVADDGVSESTRRMLDMLQLGMPKGALKAHHIGLDIGHVDEAEDGTLSLEQSAVFGVVHYRVPVATGKPPEGYRFEVVQLDIEIANSTIKNFRCFAGVTVPILFGRELRFDDTLDGVRGPEETVLFRGVYQQEGDEGKLSFIRDEPARLNVVGAKGSNQVLQSLRVQSAALKLLSDPDKGKQTPVDFPGYRVEIGGFPIWMCSAPNPGDPGAAPDPMQVELDLGGQLFFKRDPFNLGEHEGLPAFDAFGYGVEESGLGLELGGLAIKISGTNLDDQTGEVDYSRLRGRSGDAGLRDGSLVKSLPFRFSKLHVAGPPAPPKEAPAEHPKTFLGLMESGFDFAKSALQHLFADAGMSPVHVIDTLGHDDADLQYAFEYDFPMGTLGKLSSSHVDLSAKMLIGWGPSRTSPGDDSLAINVQLPSLSAGSKGFELQGLIRTTFGDASLVRVKREGSERPFYALLFAGVALEILHIKLPPGVHANFMVFADPDNPGKSNVGWYFCVTTGGGKTG